MDILTIIGVILLCIVGACLGIIGAYVLWVLIDSIRTNLRGENRRRR